MGIIIEGALGESHCRSPGATLRDAGLPSQWGVDVLGRWTHLDYASLGHA